MEIWWWSVESFVSINTVLTVAYVVMLEPLEMSAISFFLYSQLFRRLELKYFFKWKIFYLWLVYLKKSSIRLFLQHLESRKMWLFSKSKLFLFWRCGGAVLSFFYMKTVLTVVFVLETLEMSAKFFFCYSQLFRKFEYKVFSSKIHCFSAL